MVARTPLVLASGQVEQLQAGDSIVLPTGALQVGPVAGQIEFDGINLWVTTSAGRQIVSMEQWAVLSASYTLTSTTAFQQLFNDSPNGAFTLPVGLYEIAGHFELAGLSTTTANAVTFRMTGTAVMSANYMMLGDTESLEYGSAAMSMVHANAEAPTSPMTNSTTQGAAGGIITGIIRVTTAGTVIPQISMSVAAAAVVQPNSYFKIDCLGGPATTSIGNRS